MLLYPYCFSQIYIFVFCYSFNRSGYLFNDPNLLLKEFEMFRCCFLIHFFDMLQPKCTFKNISFTILNYTSELFFHLFYLCLIVFGIFLWVVGLESRLICDEPTMKVDIWKGPSLFIMNYLWRYFFFVAKRISLLYFYLTNVRIWYYFFLVFVWFCVRIWLRFLPVTLRFGTCIYFSSIVLFLMSLGACWCFIISVSSTKHH